MYSIKLRTEFKGKSADDIFKKLLIKNEKEYCIIYAKTLLYEKEGLAAKDIGLDYSFAAYAGQQLAQVTENLTYYVPPPNTQESYRFKFTAVNLESLAKTLCYIGYTYDEDGKAETHFRYDCAAWIKNIKTPQTEVTCYGLFHIARHPPSVWVLF